MTKRKETLLRGKIAAKRSFVDQINREIEALDARSCVVTGLERKAHETRVAILRRETDVLERQLVTLRNYLGKVTGYDGDLTRPGLYGVMARGYEKFIATEERSNPNPSPSPSPNPNANPNPNPNPNPNSNPKQERSARVMFEQMRRKGDAWALVREDAASILRLGTNLSVSTGYMTLGGSAALLPHTAAIFARANKLESIAPGLLTVISEHEALPLVEPHLDTILDRLDEIEPFMPFVLENFDALVPYTGTILDHFDSLALYGGCAQKDLKPLLPYLPTFAPLFDPLGPHLALCWPHLPVILPHLPVITPYVDRFTPYLSVSANADVLVWYFGWLLRIRILGFSLGRFIMSLPFLPRLAALLVRVLPRRPVRGYTCDYECDYSGCDVTQYEAALAARREFGCDDGRPSSSAILPDELQTLLSRKKRGSKRGRLLSALRRLTRFSERPPAEAAR